MLVAAFSTPRVVLQSFPAVWSCWVELYPRLFWVACQGWREDEVHYAVLQFMPHGTQKLWSCLESLGETLTDSKWGAEIAQLNEWGSLCGPSTLATQLRGFPYHSATPGCWAGSKQRAEVAKLDEVRSVGLQLTPQSSGNSMATWGLCAGPNQALKDLPEGPQLIEVLSGAFQGSKQGHRAG